MKIIKTKKGFTLIELMVVISIVSLLSSIILSSLSTARQKATIAAGQIFDSSLFHNFGGQEPAGIYDFDKGSGCTVEDESGNNTNLTLNTSNGYLVNCTDAWATSANAHAGNSAIIFPLTAAADYYANSNGRTAPFDKSNGSLSFWVKISDNTVAQEFVLIGDRFCNSCFAIQSDANGKIRVVVFDPATHQFSSIQKMPTNQWINVSVSWNSANNIILYINGKQDSSANTYVSTYYIAGTSSFNVGSGYLRTRGQIIDDFRVYTHSMQTGEAESLYAEGAAKHGIALK